MYFKIISILGILVLLMSCRKEAETLTIVHFTVIDKETQVPKEGVEVEIVGYINSYFSIYNNISVKNKTSVSDTNGKIDYAYFTDPFKYYHARLDYGVSGCSDEIIIITGKEQHITMEYEKLYSLIEFHIDKKVKELRINPILNCNSEKYYSYPQIKNDTIIYCNTLRNDTIDLDIIYTLVDNTTVSIDKIIEVGVNPVEISIP